MVDAPKNPFAKKAGGNPFAKPAVAKPLDAIKSTSFFDRVDDIESTGPTPGSKPRAKGVKKEKVAETASGGGKQQTLFSLKAAPSKLGPTESIAMTETDPEETQTMEDESEEMQEAQGVLEDSLVNPDCCGMSVSGHSRTLQVQERVGSPDWDEAQADVEM